MSAEVESNSQAYVRTPESAAIGKPARPTAVRNGPRLSILNELYIDILGCLVPGLFSVILGTAMVLITLMAMYSLKTGAHMTELLSKVLVGEKPFLAAIHYEISIVTLVSAYVIGSVFFRQDPKRPDQSSALIVWMKSNRDDRRGLAAQGGLKHEKDAPGEGAKRAMEARPSFWNYFLALFFPRKLIDAWSIDPQFPYPNLRCYLSTRGLDYLINYVPWCPAQSGFDRKARYFRTKMFINSLKIRLQIYAPEQCRDIVRNEAHVRLATSVWYACLFLLLLVVACLLALFATYMFASFEYKGSNAFSIFFMPLALHSCIGLLCLVMAYELAKCIHYMRVREVLYVLETAHLVNKEIKNFAIEEVTSKGESGKSCEGCWFRNRQL